MIRALIRELMRVATETFGRVLDRIRRHPVLGEIYEFLDGSVGDYARDHGPMYAGALAFYSILSLIPLVILLASAAGFALASGSDDDLNRALAEVMAQVRKVIPYIEQGFEDDLRSIMANRRSVGVVGAVALLISASEVFRAIEFALARIFARNDHAGTSDEKSMPRNYFASKLLFSAFITALVLGYLMLRMLFGVLSHASDGTFLSSALADPLTGDTVLGKVLTAGAIVLGFVVILKVFTHHKVHSRFAFAGGVLFATLFFSAHAIYDVYLKRFASIGVMYGSFATLIVIVLWIYFSASLLLFTCHVVKVVQRRVLHGPRWPKDGALL